MTARYAWVRWLDVHEAGCFHGDMTEAIIQWRDGPVGPLNPNGGWFAVYDLSPVSGSSYRVYQALPVNYQSSLWRIVPLETL